METFFRATTPSDFRGGLRKARRGKEPRRFQNTYRGRMGGRGTGKPATDTVSIATARTNELESEGSEERGPAAEDGRGRLEMARAEFALTDQIHLDLDRDAWTKSTSKGAASSSHPLPGLVSVWPIDRRNHSQSLAITHARLIGQQRPWVFYCFYTAICQATFPVPYTARSLCVFSC